MGILANIFELIKTYNMIFNQNRPVMEKISELIVLVANHPK